MVSKVSLVLLAPISLEFIFSSTQGIIFSLDFILICKIFVHLYIKVEKFGVHNALLASALGGLQDYNHELGHPSIWGYIFSLKLTNGNT